MSVTRIKTHVAHPIFVYHPVPGKTWDQVKVNRFAVKKKECLVYDGSTHSTLDHMFVKGGNGDKVMYIRMNTYIHLLSAPDGDKKTQRMLNNLKCHEEWHFKMNNLVFVSVVNNANLPMTEVAAEVMVEKILQEQDKFNSHYDNVSEHGCLFTDECDAFDCS